MFRIFSYRNGIFERAPVDLWPSVDTGTDNIEKALKKLADENKDKTHLLLQYQYIFTPTLGSITTDIPTGKSSLKDASNVIPRAFKEWISRFNHEQG